MSVHVTPAVAFEVFHPGDRPVLAAPAATARAIQHGTASMQRCSAARWGSGAGDLMRSFRTYTGTKVG